MLQFIRFLHRGIQPLPKIGHIALQQQTNNSNNNEKLINKRKAKVTSYRT